MLKCIYAQTAAGGQYPSYANFSGVVGTDTIQLAVRDHAIVQHTENGNHFDAGPVATTVLSREHALDLAASIVKHYNDLDEIAAENGTRTITEDTTRVGDISHTRRITVESMHDSPLQVQVARLASHIMRLFPGEPSQDQGAVDVSIRLLRGYAKLVKRLSDLNLPMVNEVTGTDLIAEGLRKGQARQIMGETQDVTTTHAFVDAGTHARPMTEAEEEAWHAAHRKPLLGPVPEDIRRELEEAGHQDGSNEPAAMSAPLGGHGENGFDVVTEQPRSADGQGSFSDEHEAAPFVRDSDLVPAEAATLAPITGRDLGDEDEQPF